MPNVGRRRPTSVIIRQIRPFLQQAIRTSRRHCPRGAPDPAACASGDCHARFWRLARGALAPAAGPPAHALPCRCCALLRVTALPRCGRLRFPLRHHCSASRRNTAKPPRPEAPLRFRWPAAVKTEICSLRSLSSCGNRPSLAPDNCSAAGCCYSSGVEHSLGKGEAGGSRPPSSTTQHPAQQGVEVKSTPLSPAANGRTKRHSPVGYGENPGGTFCERSDAGPVEVAASWLSQHRNECTGALIPIVRERFNLTSLQAIEALKQAHALQYARIS